VLSGSHFFVAEWCSVCRSFCLFWCVLVCFVVKWKETMISEPCFVSFK